MPTFTIILISVKFQLELFSDIILHLLALIYVNLFKIFFGVTAPALHSWPTSVEIKAYFFSAAIS